MKNKLDLLKTFLKKQALLSEVSQLDLLLRKLSQDIGDDWDVEEEERLISKAPAHGHLYQSDKSPIHYKGKIEKAPLGITEEVINKRVEELSFEWIVEALNNYPIYISTDEGMLPEELKQAIATLGDGTEGVFLGSGTEGIVFDIGNDKALKLYEMHRNTHEGIKSELSSKLMHEGGRLISDEAIIYDYGTIVPRVGWKILEKIVDHKEGRKRSLELSRNESMEDLYHHIANAAYRGSGRFYSWLSNNPEVKDARASFRQSIYQQNFDKAVKAYENVPDEKLKEGYLILRDAIKESFDEKGLIKKVEASFGFILADDWFDKFVKHVFNLFLTTRDKDFMGQNLGFRRSSGTFLFFDT